MEDRIRISALALALVAMVPHGAYVAAVLAAGCSDGSARGLAYGAPQPGLPDPPRAVVGTPPAVDSPAPPVPTTWREAVEAADMVDAGDRIPPAAWELALRADAVARWSDLAPPRDETTVLQAMKDIEPARGKRLCVTGRLAEVHVVRADGFAASWGTLVSTAGAITAVGGAETGDLVAGSAARFCGVVVGSRAYRNTRGGEAQTIMVAGAWDLPARRVR